MSREHANSGRVLPPTGVLVCAWELIVSLHKKKKTEASKDQAQSTYLFTAGSRLEHTQVEIEEFMQPSNECVVKWHAKACDLNLLQSSVFWSGTHAVHRQLEVNRRSTEMDPNIAFFFPC